MTRPCLLAAIAVALMGCVADGPSPGANSAAPTPRESPPSHLVVNMKDFIDTDQNGYLDSATATVYIFADGFALPLDAAGSFVFTVTASDGKTLAEWSITPEQASACRIKTQVGPGYGFNLDLRRAGAEKIQRQDAGMTGQFTDARGRSVRSGRLSVTLGSVR